MSASIAAMSALEFIAAMTAALAWPATLGIVLWVFRRQLSQWIADRPSKLKVGPVEAEWDRVASRVEVELDQPGVPPPTELVASGLLSERLAATAQSSPLGAIVEASTAVEDRLRAKLVAANVAEVDRVGLAGLARLAVRHDVINRETANSLLGLTVMRNLAIHGQGFVGTEQAVEFLALADANLLALDRFSSDK